MEQIAVRKLAIRSKTHAAIIKTVCRIPRGKVATYGEIAELSGYFGQARLVGYALHALPPGSGVPWHRVINAQGKISLSDREGKYEEQKMLLKKEGVVFIRETIDRSRFGWVYGNSRELLTTAEKRRRWQRSNIR
jgi:methylated-DNA-protein-cysteine methyltransferase-like protein